MQVRFRLGFILIALVIAGAISVVIFPASWVLARVTGTDSRLSVGEVQGPWWRGRAYEVRWGDLRLGTVAWELTGIHRSDEGMASQWAVHGAAPDYELAGHLEWRDGVLRALRAVRGHVPAAWLAPPETALITVPRGRLETDLDRVLLDTAGRPVMASGRALWRDAALTGWVAAELGTIDIRLSGRQEVTTMEWTTLEPAELELDGNARYADGAWAGELRIRAREPGHPAMERLAVVGRRHPDGSLRIPFSGRFPEARK